MDRKSNTASLAELELKILCDAAPDPDNRPLVEPFIPEMLALLNKFGNSGQSGGSYEMTADAITHCLNKLLKQKPILPLTGLPGEWAQVVDGNDPISQNKRLSSVFKGADGEPYYLDAIAWRAPNGNTWSGNAKLPNGTVINNRQKIRSFPFVPKTFIIDITEEEIKPDDWEFTVADESQLNEVFKYYK